MFILLLACVEPTTGKVHEASSGDTALTETTGTTVTTPTDLETAVVGHPRELRGFWVATVWNINFPSDQNLSVSAALAELDGLVDAVAAAHGNAIFFQVRPEGDALYASDLEPWSRYLTGTQGEDPGYDPLGELVDRAHARGIEVHAWLNPYRAKADDGSTAVAPHAAVEWPQYMVPYDGLLWMDPGADPVRERVSAVVADLCDRYAIDGVHFDDYFYPYPDGTDFDDSPTWDPYRTGGGTLSHDDWRRDNVNRLVEEVAATVEAHRDDVRFGIAPFGIYRPGEPSGITGLDQYAELYSDPVAWTDAGWLDYLAPQLYWTHDDSGQEFEPLLDWWVSLPQAGQYTFPGIYLSKLGDAGWDLDEYATQLSLTRDRAGAGAQGAVYYNIQPIQDDEGGVTGEFAGTWYPTPAASPPLVSAAGASLGVPTLGDETSGVSVSHPRTIRYWAVYAEGGGTWALDRLVPGGETAIALGAGTWAISAIDTRGVESLGVVVRR